MNEILKIYELKHNVAIPTCVNFFIENSIFEQFLPQYYDDKEDYLSPVRRSVLKMNDLRSA